MLKSQEDNQYLAQLVRELTDISSSDAEVENFDHGSYIIKQIFESGRESQFTDSLSQYVSLKNSEIEKVCFMHYQEFVTSIDQLLKVKTSTNNFKNEIIDLNTQVQNTGHKLIEKVIYSFTINDLNEARVIKAPTVFYVLSFFSFSFFFF
jgi:hypothetical protein